MFKGLAGLKKVVKGGFSAVAEHSSQLAEQVVSDINDSGAEYVVCGLGTPKQDHFAQFVKTRLNKQVKRVYTCGGFLHQSADSFDYYPEWIKKTGMRWLYRVYKEPQKVLGRLLRSYPLFIFSLASDRFK